MHFWLRNSWQVYFNMKRLIIPLLLLFDKKCFSYFGCQVENCCSWRCRWVHQDPCVSPCRNKQHSKKSRVNGTQNTEYIIASRLTHYSEWTRAEILSNYYSLIRVSLLRMSKFAHKPELKYSKVEVQLLKTNASKLTLYFE